MKSIVHLVPVQGISAWEREAYKVDYMIQRMRWWEWEIGSWGFVEKPNKGGEVIFH